MSKHSPWILALLIYGILYFLDDSGSKLLTFLLATALAQGSILLVAAAELSNAKWIAPLRKPLMGMWPLFLVPLLLPPDIDFYPWREHPTAWLNGSAVALRANILFAISLLAAIMFIRAMRAGSERRRAWAVAYIFSFVVSHSVMAVDWVMSLDYPWISTMFPALYMVEALYAGLALAGILCFFLHRRGACPPATLKDTATLTFGFALFWGGLFFAQYLTIWYANIPEEVHYLQARFHLPWGNALFYGSVVLLFAVPFFSFLINPLRRIPGAVLFFDGVILAGLLVYRAFHLLPHVTFSPLFLVVQLAALAGAVGWLMRNGVVEAEPAA
jgi:hypothetical protein